MTSETGSPESDSFSGYAVPPGAYFARRQRGPKYFITIGVWVVGIALAIMALSVVALRIDQAPTRYVCPPDCGRPPTGLPVATNPRFVAADESFSVSYPAPGATYDVTTDATSVTAVWTAGDGGIVRLFSEPAEGRTAQQIAAALMADEFPDAQKSYELPNAMVGYQPGYGEVADDWPKGTSADADHLRIIIVVAVKNDLALVAGAVGPFHRFEPDFGPGPPSPANLQVAQDLGKYVNSFSWRGDPPR